MSAASMAGLPANRARVWVAPPLSWSGPSFGFVPLRSPGAAKPHVLPLSRLWPWEVIVPEQLPPELLFATMVFFMNTKNMGAPLGFQMLPPPLGAEFPSMVLLVTVSVPTFCNPPPRLAPLPLTVAFVSIAVL